MPLDDQQTLALLRDLDDPDHVEFPRNYDHAATRARFDQLAATLDQRFRCTCSVDRDVQDASHYGSMAVPGTATAGGHHIAVRVSKFGNLVAVTLVNPGSQDGEEEGVRFESADRRRIDDVLEALGYITVPERLLRARYDGVTSLGSYFDPPTWWHRFFYHL